MADFYESRQERAGWITSRFADTFTDASSVLDVGCWERDLAASLPKGKNYYGIDIAGSPDQKIDLEAIERLPFENASYDTVVCLDVLEHIENIHCVADELFRVAHKNVIVTLPNPLRSIWSYMFKRRTGKDDQYGMYSKYYGLPLETPEDRHRWFFSYDEAVRFMTHKAKKNGFAVTVIETDMDHKRLTTLPRVSARIGATLFGKNLFADSIIFLFEPND